MVVSERHVNRGSAIITADVLALYVKFGGDADYWSRAGGGEAVDRATQRGWWELDHLLQAATLVRRGLTSAEFAARTEREIEDSAASPEIAMQIRALVR